MTEHIPPHNRRDKMGDVTYEVGGVKYTYGNEGLVGDTPKEVMAIVREHGAAIRRGVLTPEECAKVNDMMWAALEEATADFDVPIKYGDPTTYKSIMMMGPSHGGLIQHTLGHSAHAWFVRTHPKVLEMFAFAHDLPIVGLRVSFDGVNITLHPVMPGGVTQRPGKSWIHVDQAFSDPSFRAIQSSINANPVRPGDATFAFWDMPPEPTFADFAKTFGLTSQKEDWHKLTPEQEAWLEERGGRKRYVTCGAGDQIVWDSRTFHSGSRPLPDDVCGRKEEDRTYRNVVYVCAGPPPADPKKREAADRKRKRIMDPNDEWSGRLTSHWPDKVKLFPAKPRDWGDAKLRNHLAKVRMIKPPTDLQGDAKIVAQGP